MSESWFPKAGLGLFLHWGIPSVDGNTDLSWGMIKNTPWDLHYGGMNKLRPDQYYALADRFDPSDYDPDLWMAAAANAGVRYAVLTTRHHDGYALWPSQYGNLSTRTHMHGRDLLRPYVDACRKHGLRVGFYYSPPDWNFFRDYRSYGYSARTDQWSKSPAGLEQERFGAAPKSFPALDFTWNEIDTPEEPPQALKEAYRAYLRGQITELLTNYGQIDMLWFDGTPDFHSGIPITLDEIRALQPGIAINPRMHGTADFTTSECTFPTERPTGLWEGCDIWNHGSGWGYGADERYKTLGWMLDKLAMHRAWDGNFLINCAPRPDGRMPENYYLRMEALARWMKQHAEAIFDVKGGPWPETCSVPVTTRGDVWYLMMIRGKTTAGVKTERKVLSAELVETGEPVHVERTDKGYAVFQLKPAQTSDALPVIRVRFEQ